MARLTRVRRRSDSGPSSARRRATDRTSSRSERRPITSKRTHPFLANRLRKFFTARRWEGLLRIDGNPPQAPTGRFPIERICEGFRIAYAIARVHLSQATSVHGN